MEAAAPHREAGRRSYDVCVVGAGPVGQTVARELAGRGLRVVLLEAGGPIADARANERCRSQVVGDDRYGDVAWKAWRAYGGTAWAWAVDIPGSGPGARYAGFEAAVVARQTGVRRWPLSVPQLELLQARALAALGLEVPTAALDVAAADDGTGLHRGRYFFGPAARFTRSELAGLGVTVVLDAEVVELVTAGGRGEVTRIVHSSVDGSLGTVTADDVVLAANAVESARLALLLGEQVPAVRALPALGRGLMDRPRLRGRLELAAPPPPHFASFAQRTIHEPTGAASRGGTGLTTQERWCTPPADVAAGQRSAGLVVGPSLRGGTPWATEAVGRRLLMNLPDRLSRLGRTPGRLATAASTRTYAARARVHRRLLRAGYDLDWGAWVNDEAWQTCRRWQVTASVEQLPDPRNRVVLDPHPGPDGVRGAQVVWGAPATMADVRAPLDAAACALALSGLGALTWEPELDTLSSHHLMGTLAFGTDPGTSATTPEGLLRGTSNVWVAGAALFPTSGHANPTLTALALGLHVSDGVVAARTARAAAAAEAAHGVVHSTSSGT